MPGRLSNKIAIVTGASAGIGRAIALTFHREGATVVCSSVSEISRNEEYREAVSTHDLIVQEGGRALFVKADVSKAEDVEALVKKTVETYGRLDIMVNNAGVAFETTDPRPIWETSEERWDKTQSINAKGVFLGCKYATAQMIKQEPLEGDDRGWIINMSSVLGQVASQWGVSYCASKHTILGITKTVALDCAPFGVHVNAMCPSFTEGTAMAPGNLLTNPDFGPMIRSKHPFKGLGKVEDVAKAALFLVTDESSWVTGISLPVDGGYLIG